MSYDENLAPKVQYCHDDDWEDEVSLVIISA